MTRPLRLTVVCGHGLLGGAELWLLGLLDATRRLELDAVLLGDGPLEEELLRRGIPTTVLPTGARPADAVQASLRLAGILRSRRPDLVLANGVKGAVAAAPAASLAGVRCVWVKHDHTFDGPLTRGLARMVDGVVATSPALAAAAGRADALVVEPPTPPSDLVPPAVARARLHLPDDGRPLLMTAGRLVAYKGVDDAIRALAEPGGQAWRLSVVGGDDPSEPGEANRLVALARELGVTERVHFLGHVPQAADLLQAADAVAVLTKPAAPARKRSWLPRVPDREGFGMVAVEAMRAGRPVIVTGTSPVAELVAGAGVVVVPGDVAAIAEALGQLRDPQVRGRLGAQGRRAAASRPGPTASAERLVAFLAALAARPGAGRTGGPPLTVVTTVLDEAPTVDALLHRLRPQLAANDEVVVVDGGSTDGTIDVVRAHERDDGRIRLVLKPGAGISEGRNAAIAEGSHEWIAVTDAGCLPDPCWLDAFRAAAGEEDAADVITGVYLAEADDTPRSPGAAALQTAFTALYPNPDELRHPTLLVRCYGRLLGQTFDASLTTGRCVAFRRSVWKSVGGFPENLATAEDVVFGRRAVAAGARALLSADAEVRWAQRPTTGATNRMFAAYGRGDGRSGEPLLIARNLARAAAYLLGPLAMTRGPGARAAAVGTAAFYCSLPLARLVRRTPPWMPLLALPPAMAMRDLSKVRGMVRGMVEAWWGR